jgi:high-affinity nickel permease
MTTMTSISAIAGGLLGVRHAFEPDHLAAVATLAHDRSGWLRGAAVGAWWGVGHSAALMIVIAVLSWLDASIPDGVQRGAELLVATMLVVLGIRSIRNSYRNQPSSAPVEHSHRHLAHAHAGGAHSHFGERHRITVHWRPLLVGTVHGLAGSGALLLVVATTIDSTAGRLAYASMFGLGSVLGMATMSAASGAALRMVAPTKVVWTQRLIGASSVVTGMWWAMRL